MKSRKHFLAIPIALLLIQTAAMAAFTTNKDDYKKNKYSLKHLTRLSNNYLSFQSKFRAAQSVNSYFYSRETNGLSMSAPTNSFLLSQKSTTTYIYPYKYTVKIPKFKTPTRPQQ